MIRSRFPVPSSTLKIGVFAGLVGGLAEMVWISAYSLGTGTDAIAVAEGVAAAVGLSGVVAPAIVGIAIHMLLALGLGLALTVILAVPAILGSTAGTLGQYLLVLTAVGTVWAANFLVVLPRISPSFVQMVPLQISLSSKLLFGVAAATVLASRRVVTGLRDLGGNGHAK